MKEAIEKLRRNLIPIFGERESEAIIRIIFHHLKGWNLSDMIIHRQNPLSPFIVSEIDKILQRLLKHEPIQYITGEARFHGMNFFIKAGVLIPRPETDQLVDIILSEYKDKEDLRVLDLCCGSGCIAISIARNLKFPIVTAVDITPEAIEVTKLNSERFRTNIEIIKEDIFMFNPRGKYDIIVSNPPYVALDEKEMMEKNVLEYEPWDAIFVNDNSPLIFYDRIADIAMSALTDEGSLYLEINPRFAENLILLMKEKGFIHIDVLKDLYGKQRFMVCKR